MTTDNDIIRRSLEDTTVFAELFERHRGVVAGYAATRVGVQDAQDVLSDTVLVGFQRRDSYRLDVESAVPWLLGTATRIIHTHRRAEGRHLRTLSVAAAVEPTTRPDDAEASALRLDADAEVRALAPRVEALNKRDRDTLFLHIGGLTHEEIAAALSVPVGTVKSRLNRVRRRLGGTTPAASEASVRTSLSSFKENHGPAHQGI